MFSDVTHRPYKYNDGGWRLVGGARTDLSGLTGPEARALFLVAGPSSSATPEVKAEAAKEAAVAAAKITAATLNEALGRDGHATLGDILYKPGEVALRPEAAPAVQEIAKLLKETPELRLYVVGHTDDVGELKANLALSKRRAQWLVGQLRKAGVEAVRLRPDGVGPLAPVAPNRTEAGRDRNRRVELVLQ